MHVFCCPDIQISFIIIIIVPFVVKSFLFVFFFSQLHKPKFRKMIFSILKDYSQSIIFCIFIFYFLYFYIFVIFFAFLFTLVLFSLFLWFILVSKLFWLTIFFSFDWNKMTNYISHQYHISMQNIVKNYILAHKSTDEFEFNTYIFKRIILYKNTYYNRWNKDFSI